MKNKDDLGGRKTIPSPLHPLPPPPPKKKTKKTKKKQKKTQLNTMAHEKCRSKCPKKIVIRKMWI